MINNCRSRDNICPRGYKTHTHKTQIKASHHGHVRIAGGI